MTSIADTSVKIQTTSESNPSTPCWFGEVVVISSFLRKHHILSNINERVRCARKRFGHYEVIDFLAVLFGYSISGERTLEEFYENLQPFAIPFMALFERDRLPSRSVLSRFLAALTEVPVEALCTLFLDDLLARPLTPDKQTGGVVDRAGNAWIVFDIDGTREAARQRALPQTDDLPAAFRRLDDVCTPGYRGRKRGEVVRTRTTVSQAHSYQWLGSFGNRGNGCYREELRKGLAAIGRYLAASQLSQERTLLRLDGQYGNGAVLSDVAGFAFVTRGKDYHLLDHPLIQAHLHLPPDQFQQRPESQMVRSLYDCPPDGTLRCPADQQLTPHEQRREADGSLRVVYGASIHSCRLCPLREQCQWHGNATVKPRQVSVLLHPLAVGPAPLRLWDWSRKVHRRACIQLVRHQHIEVKQEQGSPRQSSSEPAILSRAQRARFRLSWAERLRRNASVPANGPVGLKLFGVPDQFADFLGLRGG